MNVTSYKVPELEKSIYLENQELRKKIKDWNKFQNEMNSMKWGKK